MSLEAFTKLGIQPGESSGLIMPTPPQFAKAYDGLPVAIALKDYYPPDEDEPRVSKPLIFFPEIGSLPDKPGWVIDGQKPDELWQMIPGRVIPLRPAEGEAGEEARQLLLQEEILLLEETECKDELIPVIMRTPGGWRELAVEGRNPVWWQTWGTWDSGFLPISDLQKEPEALLMELQEALVAVDQDKSDEIKVVYSYDSDHTIISVELQYQVSKPWRLAQRKKMAWLAKTSESELVTLPPWHEIYLAGFLLK